MVNEGQDPTKIAAAERRQPTSWEGERNAMSQQRQTKLEKVSY